jgi:hypothetical protein
MGGLIVVSALVGLGVGWTLHDKEGRAGFVVGAVALLGVVVFLGPQALQALDQTSDWCTSSPENAEICSSGLRNMVVALLAGGVGLLGGLGLAHWRAQQRPKGPP